MTPAEVRKCRASNPDAAVHRHPIAGSSWRPFCARCVWMTGWTNKKTAEHDLAAHLASPAHAFWTGEEKPDATWSEVRSLERWVELAS